MGGIAVGRRARVVLAVVVLGLLVTDVLAFRSVANRARPVSLERVIARFREQAATAAVAPLPTPALAPISAVVPTTTATTLATRATAPKPTVATTTTAPLAALTAPAPGVYLYATSGHEDTNAVGGAHHAYPAQTTMTVTSSPCGYTMRWDGLQQRWDEWSACLSGRQIVVQAQRMKHAFYGVSDQREYGCSAAMFRPGPEAVGTPVTGRCEGSGDLSTWSGRVVGPETVDVGGHAVAAIHVMVHETVTGATAGYRNSDNWFEARSGLLLRRVATIEGDSNTTVGRVHYTETVTLQLLSLVPAR